MRERRSMCSNLLHPVIQWKWVSWNSKLQSTSCYISRMCLAATGASPNACRCIEPPSARRIKFDIHQQVHCLCQRRQQRKRQHCGILRGSGSSTETANYACCAFVLGFCTGISDWVVFSFALLRYFHCLVCGNGVDALRKSTAPNTNFRKS